MAGKQKYKIEEVKKALIKANGFVSQTAKILNCDANTVYNYMNKYPELKEVITEQRESFLDLAESKLLTEINSGNLTAIIFFLKTQGRSRGYQEKTDIETKDNRIQIEIVKNENSSN